MGMRNPNPKMLLYIGMGDAYAAAAEYIKLPRDESILQSCLKFEKYLPHPYHVGHEPGMYTDDTEMSVANTNVLIGHEPPYNPKMFADAWVTEFNRGGRRKGYARRFQDFLESVKSGDEFLSRIHPDSAKNGAAMRAAPFGVLPEIGSLLEAATVQARVTHDTPEGRFSSRAVALMSHFALYESQTFTKLPDYCMACLPAEDVRRFGYVFRNHWPEAPVRDLPHASVAVTTVHAVADLLVTETSLMRILEQVIRWGGDTDSVAAIAWGIASARYQDEHIPDFFERDLESGNPATGAAHLIDLGTRFMKQFS